MGMLLFLSLTSCGPWNYIDLPERPVRNTTDIHRIHISYGNGYWNRYYVPRGTAVRSLPRVTHRTRVRPVPRQTPRVAPTVQPRRSNGTRNNASPRGPRNDTQRNIPKRDKQ